MTKIYGKFLETAPGEKILLVEAKPDFYEYLKDKFQVDNGVSWIGSLKKSERVKIFLRWKWGLESDNVNQNLEMTRKHFLGEITPERLAKADEYKKEYWRLVIMFEGRCNEIKEQLGLEKSFIGVGYNEKI